MSKPEGERFGRYLLIETIGKGGMAEIFRAVAHGVEGFQRVFVVKRILKEKCESKEFIDMFVNEARISALLNHPNIVQTYEFGQIDGSYFLAMEYLHGKDLLTVLRELRRRNVAFSPEVAAHVAQQVAAGLGHAHSLTQHGGKSLHIVHRDVSPSNVMLMRAGGVKLLDFGIAKATTDLRHSGTTQIGLIKGKLSYLSPEQVKSAPLDARSDVFSLGVVLWECLTGKRLFYDKNDYQTMRNVVDRPVPPPSTQRSNVPAALDYIVVRALERDLGQRYPSAKQMADDLDNYLKEVHFSPTALPRFLDELFGEDAGEIVEDRRMPVTVNGLQIDAHLDPPAGEEASARGQSDNVPPVSVSAPGGGRAGPLKRRWPAVGGVVALAAVIAVSASFVRNRRSPVEPSSSAQDVPSSETPTPAPRAITVGEMPPPARKGIPTAVDLVSVRFDSDPQGAEVRGEDEAPLGLTPLTLALPRAQEPVTLSIKKLGYQPVKHSIVPDRDLAAMVTLRAEEAPAPRPGVRPSPPVRRARAATTSKSNAKYDSKLREGMSIDPFADDVR